MRLFVGIRLSDESRARMIGMRDKLRSESSRGNFSRAENIHLTLVFAGECTDAQAAAVKAAVYETDFKEFEMTIDRVGRFRRIGTGTLWWAGIRECSELTELHNKLASGMSMRSITVEERKYSPHITFARDVVTKLEPWDIEPFAEKVSSIELFMSERVEGVLVYRSLFKKKAVE